VDTVTIEEAASLSFVSSDPTLQGTENLAWRAVEALQSAGGSAMPGLVTLDKAIPSAAGVGGASSDAAAALLAGRAFWQLPLSDDDLTALASALGSDVSFFLRGGTAYATGRGEMLEALPAPFAWFVIVSPDIRLERKTARLYGALKPTDCSDGGAVREQMARLSAGKPLDPALLGNAFTRPLLEILPELNELRTLMSRHAGWSPALSGAGPTHYVVFDDPEAAARCGARLRAELGRAALVTDSPALLPRERADVDSHSTT
ncbi:MAG: 4-(cytidine 5'-diphospho)-2-C-methyl-D-erythritol kinase, partial [Thermomicrobiales bacterium]